MLHRRIVWLVGLWVSTIFGWGVAGLAQQRQPDVVYVPTPPEVVEAMLKMAKVGKDDVVYDLGCGDGRIVIAAVQKFGAKRGVGIDIDPQRIRESNANARRAGVTERVKFLEQDLFQSDFRDATVVALYLLPQLNLRLRPMLFQQLKPGSRIVSHAFDMGEWKADQTADIGGRTAYYWMLPDSAAGTWRWSVPTADGERRFQLRLRQRFQTVSGTLSVNDRETPIMNGKVTGSQLTFTVQREVQGEPVTFRYSGQISGDTLKGSIDIQGGPFAGTREWTAQRDKVDLVGTWRWSVDGRSLALRIEQRNGQLVATHLAGNQPTPVEHFYVWGGGVYFILGGGSQQAYEALVEGDRLVGVMSSNGGTPKPWTAEREKR
ncbi:MAG: class I SAM-dependent methyltransferase [Abditibacteriales bacterium]|nr:class I SAM-dependent methyltransferase [Abditibacteriales bacterium]MDW8366422.1 class I SAM-dependent methyltransferase [Abditibacteriales bacterium]